MKKGLIVGFILGGIALLLGGSLLLTRMGPSAPGPSEDPIAKWNRERAALPANADRHYLAAIELLAVDAPEDWDGDYEPRIVELDDIAAWVDGREDAVEQVRQGVACGVCRIEMAWDQEIAGWSLSVSNFRTLIKFLVHRARLAALRGDAERCAESILLADGVARHAMEQPSILSNLVGCSALTYGEVPQFFAVNESNPRAGAEYARRLTELGRPLPPYKDACEGEKAILCWGMQVHFATAGWNWKQMFMPQSRIFGEIDRNFEPLAQLADQPLTARLDRNHPLHARLDELSEEKVPFYNPSRMVAKIVGPHLRRSLELNARAQVIQRGTRTLCAIFEHAGPERRFPESLEFLSGDEFAIDPYTGKPFLYRRTDGGFTLYSAGIDRDDDGGTHHARFGEPRGDPPKPADGDYVFWPIP
ncbi:MAG: hypothetical protein IT450_10000, partial [Phycisphaerales bacterium]|nr:hypothetical protein [Phycisphaerales bacterium]